MRPLIAASGCAIHYALQYALRLRRPVPGPTQLPQAVVRTYALPNEGYQGIQLGDRHSLDLRRCECITLRCRQGANLSCRQTSDRSNAERGYGGRAGQRIEVSRRHGVDLVARQRPGLSRGQRGHFGCRQFVDLRSRHCAEVCGTKDVDLRRGQVAERRRRQAGHLRRRQFGCNQRIQIGGRQVIELR